METSASIEIAGHTLLSCGLVLAVGILTSLIASKIRIPDVALFLLAGIAIGPEALGLIDEVVPEPRGGAHADHEAAAKSLREVIDKHLEELRKMRPEKLVRRRRQKFLRLGAWTE